MTALEAMLDGVCPAPQQRNVKTPVDRLVEQFEAGEFDVVAIGRALLADAAWVNRMRDCKLDGFNGYNAEIALSALA